MDGALELMKQEGLDKSIHSMGCTGGGAHKYESLWSEQVGIDMVKHGEMETMVKGIEVRNCVRAEKRGDDNAGRHRMLTEIPRSAPSFLPPQFLLGNRVGECYSYKDVGLKTERKALRDR
jgi:hypothetical protein